MATGHGGERVAAAGDGDAAWRPSGRAAAGDGAGRRRAEQSGRPGAVLPFVAATEGMPAASNSTTHRPRASVVAAVAVAAVCVAFAAAAAVAAAMVQHAAIAIAAVLSATGAVVVPAT